MPPKKMMKIMKGPLSHFGHPGGLKKLEIEGKPKLFPNLQPHEVVVAIMVMDDIEWVGVCLNIKSMRKVYRKQPTASFWIFDTLYVGK